MCKRLITAVLCAFLLATGAQRVWADPTPAYGANILLNGDAESDFGAADSTQVVKPTAWQTTGEFTVVSYGAKGDFPDISTNGPVARGLNLFEGGNTAVSTATQKISLAAYAADIDAGRVGFTLAGWLGGWAALEDNATVTVAFEPGGATAQDAKIGPVDASRRLFASGFVEQEQSGTVPKGARSAIVTITFKRAGATGYNHAMADNVSLTLSKNP